MSHVTRSVSTLAVLLTLAGPAAHAALITPVSVTASSTYHPTFSATKLIDGSGLIPPGNNHYVDYGGYLSWFSAFGTTTPSLIFDLGAAYDLTSALIWQFGYVSTWGVNSFAVQTSLDGVTYSNAGSYNMTPAPAIWPVDGLPAQEFLFAATAQYVRLNVLSNYTGPASGLSEVRFDGLPASAAPSGGGVPEPATLLLFGVGMLGLGWVRRRG